MEYIYRRNYGLISKDDMLEAGVKPERANKLMRMKLKFAFGKTLERKSFSTISSSKKPKSRSIMASPSNGPGKMFSRVSYQGEGVSIDLTVIRAATIGPPTRSD